MALKLSHHKLGGSIIEIASSFIRDWIQSSSYVVLAIALYSASVEERAMIGYFFEPQEIKWELKYMQKPSVDLRSSGHSAQLAFEKAVRFKEEVRENEGQDEKWGEDSVKYA